MPPKRKAMAEISSNQQLATASENTKAAKTSSDSTAPTSIRTRKQTYKYSNESTLSKKPNYIHLRWPNIADFNDDKDQDLTKPGELGRDFRYRVSDLGFPVSEEAMNMWMKLNQEQDKRDQDRRYIHIFDDWNGNGISELLDNFLKDFHQVLFKKNISPFKKWAYVEALACYLKTAYLREWIDCLDYDVVGEIANMMGTMVLTCYAVLAEHSLFKPDSEVKNISIISLLILEFIKGDGADLYCYWDCEVVRLCSDAGIDLEKGLRKQIRLTREFTEWMLVSREDKKESSPWSPADEYDGDGYMAAAKMQDWTPEDDFDDSFGCRTRMWYRWDWAMEFEEFEESHPGGTDYDLTQWSKKDLEKYFSGTKDLSS